MGILVRSEPNYSHKQSQSRLFLFSKTKTAQEPRAPEIGPRILGCEGRVWFDTSELDDEKYEKTLKHLPKDGGILNVDVEGIFHAGGRFGHLNGYKHKLTAHVVARLDRKRLGQDTSG